MHSFLRGLKAYKYAPLMTDGEFRSGVMRCVFWVDALKARMPSGRISANLESVEIVGRELEVNGRFPCRAAEDLKLWLKDQILVICLE